MAQGPSRRALLVGRVTGGLATVSTSASALTKLSRRGGQAWSSRKGEKPPASGEGARGFILG